MSNKALEELAAAGRRYIAMTDRAAKAGDLERENKRLRKQLAAKTKGKSDG